MVKLNHKLKQGNVSFNFFKFFNFLKRWNSFQITFKFLHFVFFLKNGIKKKIINEILEHSTLEEHKNHKQLLGKISFSFHLYLFLLQCIYIYLNILYSNLWIVNSNLYLNRGFGTTTQTQPQSTFLSSSSLFLSLSLCSFLNVYSF